MAMIDSNSVDNSSTCHKSQRPSSR